MPNNDGLDASRGILNGILIVLVSALVLGMLACPQQAHAQPKAKWLKIAAVVTCNTLDLWTTNAAFGRGAHEGNGFTTTNRIGPLAAGKISFTFGMVMGVTLLKPHWATLLAVSDSTATCLAAWHNHGLLRPE